jgi:hypothetical protein
MQRSSVIRMQIECIEHIGQWVYVHCSTTPSAPP